MRTLRRAVSFYVFLSSMVPVSGFAWQGKVVQIHDGGTITVLHNGKSEDVRLFGIEFPELSKYSGIRAEQFLTSQILNKVVQVEPIDTDRNGSSEDIISVGDLVINRLLVEHGYARVYDRNCKPEFCDEWRLLEAVAREKGRGLWKNPSEAPPGNYRHTSAQAEPRSSPIDTIGESSCDCFAWGMVAPSKP